MELHMINKLFMTVFSDDWCCCYVLSWWAERAKKASWIMFNPRLVTKSVEVQSSWGGLPFEVEHRVYLLDFNPPVTSLHRFSNKLRVVSRSYYEFVAVWSVSVFKRDFASRFFDWVFPLVKHLTLSCGRHFKINLCEFLALAVMSHLLCHLPE